jgi:hypothetical protein
MKKILAVTCFAAFSLPALAFADGVHLFSGIGFSAPNVTGTGYVGNPQTGDIIFDTTNSGFYGYNGSTWTPFVGSPPVAPTVQRFTSGTGTYTTPTSPAPLYIRVRMVGGGGGGAGNSSGLTSNGGTSGNNTTFGSSFLTAGGGTAGSGTGSGGAGGTNTINAGAITLVNQPGSPGAGCSWISTTGIQIMGGAGGNSPYFSGGGPSGPTNSAGGNAIANSGGGGGGAGSNSGSNYYSGPGGGSGGYIDVMITSPSSTYSYSVGGSASGGTGVNLNGGQGASGQILVEEYYQ